MDINSYKSRFSNFADLPYYPHQAEAIRKILSSSARVIVVHAPTGSGKSLIGASVGQALSGVTYLVHSIALQEQIISDFPEFALLKGRANYRCGDDRSVTADNCTAMRCPPSCDYKSAKENVLESDLQILNYAYFLAESNFIGRFSGVTNLICDEADMLEHILTGFIKLTISENLMRKLRQSSPPKYKTTSSNEALGEWTRWAQKMLYRAEALKAEIEYKIRKRMTTQNEHLLKLTKDHKQIQGIIYKLHLFVSHVDKSWLFERQESRYGISYNFEPLWFSPS